MNKMNFWLIIISIETIRYYDTFVYHDRWKSYSSFIDTSVTKQFFQLDFNIFRSMLLSNSNRRAVDQLPYQILK